jgi:hypothetical protein
MRPPALPARLVLALSLLPACSGSHAQTSTSGPGGSASEASSSTAAVSSSAAGGLGGAGGSGGAGGAGGGCVDKGPQTTTFVPTPADIQFQALAPLPSGELFVFNDWNVNPNTVSAVTVDGATTTKVFEAFRVWSMGVSHSAGTIAFACGDPQQLQHYGTDIGDSIQHTWLYDVATEGATLLTDGNVNDECHTFGPGDATLYLCRRYDFTNCGNNKGYRVGEVDLGSKMFSFLTPDDPSNMTLDPAPTPDQTTLLFTIVRLLPNGQEDDIEQQPLSGGMLTGMPADLRKNASNAVISPDGTRYAYLDYTDGGRLWVSNLDGTGAVRVAPERGDSVSWSPDGTRVAYLGTDLALNCQHIEITMADGSTAATPTKIRDCGMTGEYITTLAWITRP